MVWQDYIHTDLEILNGKPLLKGTRLSVEFLLDLLAVGWTEQQILSNYSNLTEEALRAVFAYAAESMREETIYILA